MFGTLFMVGAALVLVIARPRMARAAAIQGFPTARARHVAHLVTADDWTALLIGEPARRALRNEGIHGLDDLAH